MAKAHKTYFPAEEFELRRNRVRQRMERQGLNTEFGLDAGRIALEEGRIFLPYGIVEGVRG